MITYKAASAKKRAKRTVTDPEQCSLPHQDEKTYRDIDMIRGITRIPLGQDPERDCEIKRAWSRGA